MKIDHIAIWVNDLEKAKTFYVDYFGMVCNEKYLNPKKQFSSYFLSCKGAGTRMELMHRPDLSSSPDKHTAAIGLTHFAIAVDSKETVNSLTEKLREDGYKIVGEPRTTGDGYYESVVEDGEGNQVEITVHEPLINKAEIEEMEFRLIEAIKISDLSFLDSVMHPDLIGLTPDGHLFSKEVDMASHLAGSMVVEALTARIEEIRITGDTAFVIISYNTKGTMLGTPIAGNFRYNRVWKKMNGQLQIITVSCMQISE